LEGGPRSGYARINSEQKPCGGEARVRAISGWQIVEAGGQIDGAVLTANTEIHYVIHYLLPFAERTSHQFKAVL
jgi:hypothetical protein